MLRKGLALVLVASLALPLRAEEPELAPLPTAPRKSLKAPPWLRKNKQGTLQVKSGTRGAAVQVDGLDVGVVPLGPLTLPPGTHEVRVTRRGYRELSQRVTVRAGKKTSVSLTLSASRDEPDAPQPALPPLPAAGELPATARSEATAPMVAPPPPPPLAKVDEPAPPLPALPALPATAELPAPPLVMADSKPAPPAAPAQIALRPSVPAEALAPPPEDKPLTERWYFWGGAAAAALVVAAGVVYALPARYVEKRDPTVACGGPCVVVNK